MAACGSWDSTAHMGSIHCAASRVDAEDGRRDLSHGTHSSEPGDGAVERGMRGTKAERVGGCEVCGSLEEGFVSVGCGAVEEKCARECSDVSIMEELVEHGSGQGVPSMGVLCGGEAGARTAASSSAGTLVHAVNWCCTPTMARFSCSEH
jgi:hypothetical protein